MALGTGAVIPAQIAIQSNLSSSFADFIEQFISIVPKNPSGSVYDCTSATGMQLVVSSVGFGPWVITLTVAPTMLTHNASGITFNLTSTQQGTLQHMGTPTCSVGITITDGTTTQLIAQGTYKIGLSG